MGQASPTNARNGVVVEKGTRPAAEVFQKRRNNNHLHITMATPPRPKQLFFAAVAPEKDLLNDPILPLDADAIAFPHPTWNAIQGSIPFGAFIGIKRGYHYIRDVTKEVQDYKRRREEEEIGATIVDLSARMTNAELQETIEELQQTIEELQQTSADQTIEALQQTIKTKEQDLTKSEQALQKREERITELETANTKQQQIIEDLRADLENLTALVRKQVEPLYRAVNK